MFLFVEADSVDSGSSSGSGDDGSGYGSTFNEDGESEVDRSDTSDFGFTPTVSVPDIKRPGSVATTTVKPTNAADPMIPSRMTLHRAFSIITVPILIAWLGSVF